MDTKKAGAITCAEVKWPHPKNNTGEKFNKIRSKPQLQPLSVRELFSRAMAESGICPSDDIQADGRLHRFHVKGDMAGSKNGWYVLHADDLPFGFYGSWRQGKSFSWRSSSAFINSSPAPTRKMQVTDQPVDANKWHQLRKTIGASVPLTDPRAHLGRLYLRQRLAADIGSPPNDLLFHPSLPYFDNGKLIDRYPALLAVIRGPSGNPISLHRTYINGAGYKADLPSPKKIMGVPPPLSLTGAAIRLYPAGNSLVVAEGIETALSLRLALNIPVWATITAHGMETVVIPPEVKILIIGADHDLSGRGQEAAQTLSSRMKKAGLAIRVMLPAEPGDWNDVLLKGRDKNEC